MPQSLSKVYLHLIFSTKRRELNIVTRPKEEMFSYIAQTLNRLGCTAIVVGGTENHIHALFCMSKTKSIIKKNITNVIHFKTSFATSSTTMG